MTAPETEKIEQEYPFASCVELCFAMQAAHRAQIFVKEHLSHQPHDAENLIALIVALDRLEEANPADSFIERALELENLRED
jgi:Flp pilus assembly protein TadD